VNIKLDKKMIKELCGTVSFKRGDSFYRSNKVSFIHYSSGRCEAVVNGSEQFQVTIEKNIDGGFRTSCSCPKLDSFQKDCQHVAAVLISIEEHTRKGTFPSVENENLIESGSTKEMTDRLLSIFNNHPKRPSGQQLHFENRKVIDAEFICIPVLIAEERYLFGMKIKIGQIEVRHIRDFLVNTARSNPNVLSKTFTYEPGLYCFEKEADTIIHQLIEVVFDEKTDFDESNSMVGHQILLIPPSSWERLLPFLSKIKLEYAGKKYDAFQLSEEKLPLQFEIAETNAKNYHLKIAGLDQLVVMDLYGSVLIGGNLFHLSIEDCNRLVELKQMIADIGSNYIVIAPEQLNFFLEKVIPSLSRLGDVRISASITKQLEPTPLVAKLYLDRVKNRLLVGLEFHYEHIVINPLENREPQIGTRLIRDREKENSILAMMEESSFAKTEGGYYLHNEQLEYEFLYNVVPKLQKLAQIYATTAVRNRIFRGNAKPMIRVKMKKERVNWLEFKFEMDGIPEQHIREILLALEEKRKYYRLKDGSLLSLETREFEEIKRFLNSVPAQNEDFESGLNLPLTKGLHVLDSLDESQIFMQEESFRQFIESIQNPEHLAFDVPESLEPILRDYQKQGFKWMKTLANYGFGGILADSMGLGKTLQSIAFILSELPEIRGKMQPVLIVCPTSLTYNWLHELMKFTPSIKAVIVEGNQTGREKIIKELNNIDVVITTYSMLRRDIKTYEKHLFHAVFYDEAQAFKNPVTQTARAVKKIRASYRFALTGTPVENSLEELWSIFHVVFPELFQGLKEFSRLSQKTIARRIRPFLLRRYKEDVLSELPEKIETYESAELYPDQKKLYAAYLSKLRHETLKHLNKDTLRKNRIKILAGLTRLRQICCHPALFVDGYKGSSAKFEQLIQIVDESKFSGRRVLIFSQFTKMLELIGREFAMKGLPFFYLDGQTPSEARLEMCNRFNSGERDFFLISLKAGGTGLNLTGADTVVLYDIWWNPAVEEQAADRAHRIGQKNTVQVIKLIARGTIEEKMNELQEKKRHLVEEIIDSEKKGSSTLTEEDIREILMI
jgi:SNF2 family DNA or RNA helicase